MTHPTEQDIVFDIAKTHEKVEGNLSARQYTELGEYNASQARNKFGSWNNAKKEAGVPRNNTRNKNKDISTEELLQDISEACKKSEGRLTQKKYREHGKYSVATIYNRFESFTEAKKQAGIEQQPYQNKKKVSDEQLLKDLNNGLTFKEIAEKHGYSGTSSLSQRVSGKNWDIRNKLNDAGENNDAMILSVSKEQVKKAGLEIEDPVYYDAEVTNQGTIKLDLTTERVRQKD